MSTTETRGTPEAVCLSGGDEERERLRRERALRKKLKQIRDLEVRIVTGEIGKPDHDQEAKIAKKAEIEAELLELMRDSL